MEKFFQISQPNRFAISGLTGTVLYYVVFQVLLYLWDTSSNPFRITFQDYKGSAVLTLSYLLSIVWQMELHARLVYQIKINNYSKTLFQTYLAYGISILGSAVSSYLMVDLLQMNSNIAFGISLGITGVLNYYTVSSIMSKKDEKKKE